MFTKLRFVFTALVVVLALPRLSVGQTINSVTISPNPAVVGGSATGTITLSKVAASAGLKINLSSSASATASVPASVTVEAGTSTATFAVAIHKVATTARATITGTDPAKKTVKTILVVNPPAVRLMKLAVAPVAIKLPATATGTVTLSAAAPANGFVVNLSSTQQFVSLPASVSVKAGAKTATFTISGSPITKNTSATIKGIDANGYSATGNLMVQVPSVRVASLNLIPSQVSAGTASSGVVTLTAVAPKNGFDVDLSSDQPFATLPAKVTVKAGSKTGTFSIATDGTSNGGTANLMAMDTAGYMAMASLTVTVPTIRLSTITISPSAVTAPAAATGTIKLSGAAPSGGLAITLSSVQSFVNVPTVVTVNAGATSATFNIATTSPNATSTATIKGVDPNGFSATATLTVSPQSNTASIQMTNGFQYSPQALTVSAGTTIVWINSSNMAHTITPDLSNPSMTSGTIIPGQSFTWTVPANAKSGTKFFYHCLFHGGAGDGTTMGQGMAGVVIVQ